MWFNLHEISAPLSIGFRKIISINNSCLRRKKIRGYNMKCKSLFVGMMALLLIMPVVTQAASFLENEAGISASIQVTGVNINLAATAFKAIEKQSDGYIIGSVALSDYDETHDVHVYVDISGAIIAYYLKNEPPSKIIDWRHYSGGIMTLAGSKLEDALVKVCAAMSIILPEVEYYDFRYPGATNFEIIVEENSVANTTDIFRFLVPNTHLIYNASWSHAVKITHDGYYNNQVQTILLDEVVLNTGTTISWAFWDGNIAESLLSPDIYHEFKVINSKRTNVASDSYQCFGALVLSYSIP